MTTEGLRKLEDKLDDVKNDLTDVKLSVVRIETLMSERAKEDLPARVRQLENFKSRVAVYGSVVMIAVTAGVQLVVHYIKGMVS